MTVTLTHGTLYANKTLRCSCEPCKETGLAHARNRHRRIGYGTWQPFVDAEPVRDHVRELMAKGSTLARIATAADYDLGSLGRIFWGRSGQPPSPRITPAVANRILAVTLPQAGISPLTEMDATGTHRRLQALQAAGWPLARIGRELGYDKMWIFRMRYDATVPARVAERVARVYEQLKDLDPEANGVRPQDAKQSRKRAEAAEWPRPEIWDTDIDDPAADPQAPDPETAVASVADLSRDEQMAIAKTMTLAGHTAQHIADRLGVTSRTVIRWRTAGGWKCPL